MKNRILSILALLLLFAMLASTFAACKDTPQDDPEQNTDSESSSETQGETEGSTEGTTNQEAEKEPVRESLLSGDYASLIENAYWLSNGVTAYYTNPIRNAYAVENQKMNLTYNFDPEKPQLVTALTTPGGKPYITDTMDVYVKMDNGKTFYASESSTAGTANIYRFGYYYYDVHLADQNFTNEVKFTGDKDLNLSGLRQCRDTTTPVVTDGVLTTTITSSVDPYIYGNLKFRTNEVNNLQLTMRTTSVAEIQLYIKIGSDEFSNDRWVVLPVINDGEWHTYNFALNDLTIKDYSGTVNAIRLDFVGSPGDTVEIKDLKVNRMITDNAPPLYLDRTLHVYSDKMNHVVRICAMLDTDGIAEIGQITDIAADTVDKLIVKDAQGEHTSLDGVDWATAEYIAFDVKGVGIFGYILLKDASSGSMKVTLEDSKYRIVQYTTPKNGTILAPQGSTENDFYMGQRIYTDLTHDFEAFRKAAYEERNPLSPENIKVDTEKAPMAAYAGYDAIRGAYKFTMEPESSFNTPYYKVWNKHYNLVFDITGDDHDRNVYVMTYAHGTCLENGVLLGEGDMLLPVPLEVCKNFAHEHEEPLFDNGDDRYSETYFPMTLKAGDTDHYSVLNLYQNWGNFPLKQISSIQFFAPYYHLSTGVSESNCIAPYYVYHKDLQTLPDHRAMSAPLWSEMDNPTNGVQPQHTSGGYHYFLQYTDAEGNHYATDNTRNVINSYGPTYADIDMDYITDDGKIKVTYNHMEMPQTDENRTYYQMTYEVLEDVSFENLKRDFSFYSVRGLLGDYGKMGYLNSDNQPAYTDLGTDSDAVYFTLGDQYPYFDMFKLINGTVNDFVNISFLIKDAKFIIGGQETDVPFVVRKESFKAYLTLDLEQVTFKKGDKFTINAIIMPWGSQLTDYAVANPDKNVLDVRQNSLIDSVKLDMTTGEDISNAFLPMIKSKDGKAEFTISGGENNIVLRVFGFDTLSVPKVYEKINGEWVEYKLNSLGSPDKEGYEHYYDGYMVYYDGDGTFSYSFVVAMADKARTFKVELDKDFKGWPTDPKHDNSNNTQPPVELPLMVYFTPEQIAEFAKHNSGLGEITKAEDGSYVRLHGNGTAQEAYFNVFAGNIKQTGQYVAIRYRTPKSDTPQFGNIEFFAGNQGDAPSGQADFAYTSGLIEDGEWHVLVFDLASFLPKAFLPADDGTYSTKYLRLDAFGVVTPPEVYMDIAWIGMDASLDEIKAECQDMENIQLATGINQIELIPTK